MERRRGRGTGAAGIDDQCALSCFLRLLGQPRECRRLRHCPATDPAEPAEPSPSAKRKEPQRKTREGLAVHSLKTLIEALGARCRIRCRTKTERTQYHFSRHAELTPLQARAFELLELFPVR